MISNFSSFVEFFAAVYVTMCIDNVYCKQFWTPVYYKEMNDLLSSYDFTASSLPVDKIKDEIEATNERVQSFSQHKGSIMLCFCILLLIFMGFEGDNKNVDYIPLIYCSLIVGCLVTAPNLLLRTWRWVVFWLFALIFLYYYVDNTESIFIRKNVFVLFLLFHLRWMLVLLISIPIMHQLYLDWLYSRIYKAYLKNKIQNEYEKYKKSLDGIRFRKEKMVHKHYKEACFKSCFSSKDDDTDDTLTLFNEVLRNRLLSAASPWQLTLISSLVKHWILCCKNRIAQWGCSETYDVTPIHTINDLDIRKFLINDYSSEYKEYIVLSKKPNGPKNIRAFCKYKGLNAEEMIMWVKKNKPARKIINR